jgi:hypothetical protein
MTQENAVLRAEFEEQLQFEMLLTEISRFHQSAAEQVNRDQDAQRRIVNPSILTARPSGKFLNPTGAMIP